MQNRKLGGKRLLKKAYLTKDSLRRWLSLLLSLCMVVSLFSGIIAFPAFAQQFGPEDERTELQENTQEIKQAETMKEIKARLLRQIREEGWDPYGSDMSLDEFYALMELFQEGVLPLEEKGPVAEITGPDNGGAGEENDPAAEVADPDSEGPDAEDPKAEDPAIEGPAVEEPTIEDPAIEGPTVEEPTIEDPAIEGPAVEEPTIEDPAIEGPAVKEPTIEEPGIDDPYIVRPDTEEPTLVEPAPSAPVLDDPGKPADKTEPVSIPRTMFLFSGVYAEDVTDQDGAVHEKSTPGTDVSGHTHGSPLIYDNENGHIKNEDNDDIDEDDYKSGLDPYGEGYTRPPRGWEGVGTDMDNEMKAIVIVPGVNSSNPHIASDVDQDLFLQYTGYYVYKVTAQNNDVTILGAIPVGESYVYYYTNYLMQDTTVSATTLPEGEKFVIEYVPNEYTIEYKVLLAGGESYKENIKVPMRDLCDWIDERLEKNDWDNPVSAIPNISDVTTKYKETVYGAFLPSESDLGAYAFTAKAPDGYTLSFYMARGDETGWEPAALKLGTIEETDIKDENGDDWQHEPEKDDKGNEITWQMERDLYTAVNNGWALGEEPVYDDYPGSGFKIMSKNHKSPEYLTLTGTFYNNTLDANRMVVAVLRKKPEPVFSATNILVRSAGAAGRGTTAIREIKAENLETGKMEDIPYDYEDVYLWASNQQKPENAKYDYSKSSFGGASKSNLEVGNIATADRWNWTNVPGRNNEEVHSTMYRQTDGTYSFQWTFQTNSSDNYLLDALEINRVGIQIPFYTRYRHGITDLYEEYRGDKVADNKNDSGLFAWSTTTSLPDGAQATVEYLMLFNDGKQRVYRITVTGAKNNVTITALNLMQYVSGAPEFSTYDLDGITGATSSSANSLRLAAIQYYGKRKYEDTTISGWGTLDTNQEDPEVEPRYNVNRGNVVINSIDYGSSRTDQHGNGSNIGLDGGDTAVGGANIRFKLADGYANPYYLYESARSGVIAGGLSKDDKQASVHRDMTSGEVLRSTRNSVVPFISDGDDPYMAYYDSSKYNDAAYKAGTAEFPFVHPPKTDTPEDKEAFVKAEPIPVTKNGEPLYDANGKLYTDWSMIQISTDNTGRQTLYPVLFDKNKNPLGVDDVIAPWKFGGNCVFSEEDRTLLKSNYIYRGASNKRSESQSQAWQEDNSYWYYIRVSGQGKWNEEGTSYASSGGDVTHSYKMALLTIVAYPMRYMVRYKPGTLPDYSKGDVFVAGGRPPADMPTWIHDHDGRADGTDLNDTDCPAFPPGHVHNPDKPHEQFDDDEGNFYNVESNYDIAIVSTKPRDPLGYFDFQGWILVDDNDRPVQAHVYGEDGHWLRDQNGEYVTTTVVFRSGSFDLKNYAEFAIENENMGGNNTDIYVLRLMPLWEGVESPYRYNVALNWVDVNGKVHMEYFSDYWPEIVTSFDPGAANNELVVKVLTESIPLRTWLARNGTYVFWDEVNNAENNEVRGALEEYFKGKVIGYDDKTNFDEDRTFQAALEKLSKMYVDTGGATGRAEFGRLGNYTYSISGDGGTIIIWMQEIYGALEFHKEVEAEPFIVDDEFYFTVEPTGEDGIADGIYYAYPDKAAEDVLPKEGWQVQFKDGKIHNIKQNDDSVPWPEGNNRVTCFTLRGGEGITFYVPEGEYAIRELGSKSGGSYQALVEYVDKVGNQKGNDWDIPKAGEDHLWLKGSQTAYIEGNTEEISQLSAEGPVLAGAANMVRAINFHNRTSTVAFEKTVVGPYRAGDQFGFEVTLTLEDGTEPLKDDDGNYYFNFNLYDVDYEFGMEPGEKPDDANQDWRPDGTLKAVASGRMVVVNSPAGSNAWKSQDLRVLKREWVGDPSTGHWESHWTPMNTNSGVWLEASQRIYVVCTVPKQGDINYIIEETAYDGYRVVGDPSGQGVAKAAELAYERFVNSMLMVLPSTGGSGGIVVLLSGAAFLASAVGLALLNRDLLRKRRRHLGA